VAKARFVAFVCGGYEACLSYVLSVGLIYRVACGCRRVGISAGAVGNLRKSEGRVEMEVEPVLGAHPVLYFGWIAGSRSNIPALRALGVRGAMTFRVEQSTSVWSTIWVSVCRVLGSPYLNGVIEHCECTEDVMEKLIKEWPGFWLGSFTGCVPPHGQGDQLPRGQQKYSQKGW